ncbi:MAG: RlmE family RNA methyltransferase [Planctomycetaceae bacterium]|nr:RlmE family RNA methyltransferase [Planctomycetaceae bacterium]
MRKLHDRFFKQAKREGKLARSVYKLEELNRRERIIRKGDSVLDLGASPGSWLEYILEVIGPDGVACAIDLKPIHKKFKGRAEFKKMNILDMTGSEFVDVAPDGFNAVVSDMAPNTTGIRITDQLRSLELCEAVLALAQKLLKKDGDFVCKIFYGAETEQFRARVGKFFKTAKIRKPQACRDESIEHYVLGLGYHGGTTPSPVKDS